MDDRVGIVGVVGGCGCHKAWGVGIEQGCGHGYKAQAGARAWACGREQGRVGGQKEWV